ncbi:uncharacterized protein LOC113566565 [Drosophila persimilis]|uniref:Uncharacterized protein n=1 Tax=Drosophila pseudoobscura pseudoobscura TaxID=46245 RepID=Q2M013_DROPS|nr:uncharacterized protein LOC113566565 [Drosophila persimilis]XP_033240617.1 uncharacterized protein LOC4813196 [Drosophila pseudoobscura]
MKYFVICALAALVLIQAASGFKIRRVVYVVPVASSTTTIAPVAGSSTTVSSVTTTAPPKVIYCSWKNNWCRPASNTMTNCKWGICKYTG